MSIGIYYGDGVKILSGTDKILASKSTSKLEEKLESQIKKSFSLINEKKTLGWSFADGISGFLWALNYCQKNLGNFISKDSITQFDKLIFSAYEAKESFDLFYGRTGLILYAIEAPDRFEKLILQFINDIDKTIFRKSKLFLPCQLKDRNGSKQVTYLGLAHGVFGILIILIRIQQSCINNAEIRGLIDRISSSLIDELITNDFNLPLYLNADEELYDNFGWCHGNVGVGTSLISIGNKYDNKSFIDIGVKLLNKSIERQFDLNSIGNNFCHGLIGIFYMFQKAYRITGNINYKEYAEISRKLSLEDKKYYDEGLLLGESGFNAMLNYGMGENNLCPWDRVLLI